MHLIARLNQSSKIGATVRRACVDLREKTNAKLALVFAVTSDDGKTRRGTERRLRRT